MTARFGSTKMPTARDKRRQSRKLYRKMRRSWRGASSSEDRPASSPHPSSSGSAPISTSLSTQNAAPPCELSTDRGEDDGEGDSKPHPCSSRQSPSSSSGTNAPSRKVISKASRLERAAHRRVSRLQRTRSSTISPLDNCLLLEIATYSTALDLHTLFRVNRRWRWTLQAHDSFLWKPHCIDVWAGRYVSRPELMPFVQEAAATLPQDADPKPSSPTYDTTTEHMGWNEKPPQSWREALCRSIVHGRSTTLSSSEMAAGAWQICFKLDPTIPPQRIQFFSSPAPHVRTPGFPQMPWALYQGGTVLHVHVFPEQAVTRDALTWKWAMQNRFVGITSVPGILARQPLVVSDLLAYLPPPFAPSPSLEHPASDSDVSEVSESSPERPYPTDQSEPDVDPTKSPVEGCSTPEPREDTAPLAAELQRFLSKPRIAAGRDRPAPIVCGHGGDCDGEDPPPQGAGIAAATPCVHSEASSAVTEAAGCDAGRCSSDSGNGTTSNTQQVGSRLSMATCALFDAVMCEEHALCARSKELCAFQALGTVRRLDHAPRRMRLNFPAHLLDQGHPRKPP